MEILTYIGLLFTIWMGIDCIQSKRENPFLWIFIIFLLQPIGAVIYFFKFKQGIKIPSAISGSLFNSVKETGELRTLKQQLDSVGGFYQHQEIGLYYLKHGYPELAQKHLTEAVKKNPTSLNSKYGLAKSLFAMHKFKEAASIMEEIVKEDEHFDYGQALFGLAECYRMGKDEDKATNLYAKLDQASASFQASIYYAEILDKKGKGDEALTVMKSIVERSKKLPEYKYEKEASWIKKAESFISSHT
ncbi:MAG: tetratricopeptide repeat protein [Nitrospinota bacterium]|nr:tetratricopeptide repeat protein [Nitrospinota bacterium]